ncbi:MAG: flagellar motor protein [Nitrospinae bacterium]|nr:flagellar motor protein [Nitrospinota bacterium]
MEITSIIGLFGGIAAVLVGQMLEGGHVGALIQLTAGIIVFGGTLGATVLSFTLNDFKKGVTYFFGIFKTPGENPQDLLTILTNFAGIARKDGILALQNKVADIRNQFMKRAITYAVDGYEPAVIQDILEKDIETKEEEMLTGSKVWEAAGGYAPTVGILGAVLGLIHVMEVMADPSMIGKGIAVAFVATVYGVGAANLLFLPISSKIKRQAKVEVLVKELIIKGVMSIQEGLNPRIVEEKLNAFLEEGLRKVEGKK